MSGLSVRKHFWLGAVGSVVAMAAACGSEDGGEETVGLPAFGAAGRSSMQSATGAGGRGGSSATAQMNAGGSPSTEMSPNPMLNAGGSGADTSAMMGGGAMVAGGGAAAMGGAGGAGMEAAMAGAGGAPMDLPLAAGRIGSELCPPGPFDSAQLMTANLQVTLVGAGQGAAFNWEGPVWVEAEGALYFSEIDNGQSPPPARINRLVPGQAVQVGVFANTGSNGIAVDATGNLIAATHDVGALSRFSVPAGTRSEVGPQQFMGSRLNSPNDLVVRRDGNIYFSDPSYQAPNPAPQGNGNTRVYRLSPDGAITAVDALGQPNGVTLSLDESQLFVADQGGLFRYNLDAAGLASGRVSLNQGGIDGMALDCAGNLYLAANGQGIVRILTPDGEDLVRDFAGGQLMGSAPTNVAFGGADHRTLYITAMQPPRLFSVQMPIPGLPY